MSGSPSQRQRWGTLLAVGLLLALIASAFSVAVGQDADDWSQYANDSRHTGHNPNIDDVREKPGVEWWAETGFVVNQPPVVSDGVIYYWDRGFSIVARNASTGELLWRRTPPSESEPESPPAIADGRLYINIGDRLYAFNSSTGDVAWSSNYSGHPTVHENRVYPTAGVSLNASTGDVIWERNLSTYPSSLSIADGNMYTVDGSDVVRIADAATGKEVGRYRVEAESASLSDVIADGGRIYSASDSAVYALDRSSGERIWKATGYEVRYISVGDEAVYLTGGSEVTALDSGSGEEIWSYQVSEDRISGIAIGNRTLYTNVASGQGGEARAIDIETGRELWKFGDASAETDNLLAFSPTPVPGDGLVYAAGVKTAGRGRNLFVLSENGTPLGELGSDSNKVSEDVISAVIGWLLLFITAGGIYVAYRRM